MDKLTPLRDVIARYDLAPRKALGQHFLLDGNLTDTIVRYAGEFYDCNVIEVGPGPGGLTRSLLAADPKELYAIEMDPRCVVALQELKDIAGKQLTITQADALHYDLIASIPAPRTIVANLPYNIGTELLFRWLQDIHTHGGNAYRRMVLMFQKEVAERIAAQPGSKAYGKLSIMSQWLCEVSLAFDIPPQAFTPPPKVDSSVVVLVPRAKPLIQVEKKTLEKVVNTAFQQRRKMLRASLKSLGGDTVAILERADVDPTARAETLSVEQFCELAIHYSRHPAIQSQGPA